MPDYDFSSLSPVDFEALVAELLNAELGVHVESFGPGRDKGVDLRCAVAGGSAVIQCKHFLRGGRAALRRAVKKEAAKWKTATGIRRYILATSVSMTVESKEELVRLLSPVLPTAHADVLGLEDLNALLARHPQVELGQFKLWTASAAVLSRIVHAGLWNRTEELLESVEKRAKYYVGTQHFNRVMRILEADRVCVVTGPPGVGKSILAEMALLAHGQKQWQVVQISADVKEGFDAWNHEIPQIFYYDDFLGQTDLAETTGKNEDHRIAQFVEKVRRADAGNKRFILTTREQVFRDATERSDRIRRSGEFLTRAEVQIEHYSPYVKAHIFYNHLYFSDLPAGDKKLLAGGKDYFAVIGHPNYSPRILEQVVRHRSQSLDVLMSGLKEALDHPEELWAGSYHHLSPVGRGILSVLVTYPPEGIEEKTLWAHLRGFEPYAYQQALKVLEGTWITISTRNRQTSKPRGTHVIALANPSCRDYLLHRLGVSRGEAEVLLSGLQDIRQLLMLLRYSGLDLPGCRDGKRSTRMPAQLMFRRVLRGDHVAAGAARHEGLKEAVIDNVDTVVEKVKLLFDLSVEERKAAAGRGGFRPFDRSPATLATVMPFMVEFGGPEAVEWCARAVAAMIDARRWRSAGPEPEGCLALLAATQHYRLVAPDVVNGLVDLTVSRIYDPADMELFFETVELGELSPELRETVRDEVVRLAEAEADHWRSEYDFEAARNAADVVESIARRAGVSVDSVLDDWRESVDQNEADFDEEPLQAPSPSRRSAEGDGGDKALDMQRVVDLFSTLADE
ncbi:restriction endonuclease [Kitasatospora sp. NPDC059088]|uniref:nSTAND3 domain-containing NTPase n=1 Tax=Kitasatospora sp. NPDC059088 TaxID=3346722 RepID=UPI0036D0776C